MKLQDAIDDYLETARTDRTRDTYRRCFTKITKDIIGDIDTDAITHQTFRKLIRYKGPSPAYHALLNQAFINLIGYLQLEGHCPPGLTWSDALLIRKKEAGKVGTDLQKYPAELYERVIVEASRAGTDEKARRLYALVLTFADTGMRVFEVCSLKRGNLDFSTGKAEKVVGKGGVKRTVRFSDRTLNALRAYFAARKDTASGRPLHTLPLFSALHRDKNKVIRPLSLSAANMLVKDFAIAVLGEDAGAKIHPHGFRHLFVTKSVEATGDIALVAQLVGHKSVAITGRYTHLDEKDIDRAYREIFNQH